MEEILIPVRPLTIMYVVYKYDLSTLIAWISRVNGIVTSVDIDFID